MSLKQGPNYLKITKPKGSGTQCNQYNPNWMPVRKTFNNIRNQTLCILKVHILSAREEMKGNGVNSSNLLCSYLVESKILIMNVQNKILKVLFGNYKR